MASRTVPPTTSPTRAVLSTRWRRGGRTSRPRTCGPRASPRVVARGANDMTSSMTDASRALSVVPLIPGSVPPTAGHGLLSFVDMFRQASPYIEVNRGTVIVVVVPGEVVAAPPMLDSVLQDVALLSFLGVRVLLVVGASPQIDALLRSRGKEPVFVRGYRVTDDECLRAITEAGGQVRVDVEARLSKGAPVPQLRRVGSEAQLHGPVLRVVSGNYVAAKRRGVVGGVDYGYTGEVRYVDAEGIQERLATGDVVLLTNLGYSAAGETLNCNVWEVATAAAVQCKADKLFCLLWDLPGKLPTYLPLDEAEALALAAPQKLPVAVDGGRPLEALVAAGATMRATARDGWLRVMAWHKQLSEATRSVAVTAAPTAPSLPVTDGNGNNGGGKAGKDKSGKKGGAAGAAAPPPTPPRPSLEHWYLEGCPVELSSAVYACKQGVPRVHLVNARTEGSLLLELYTRDGVGTMISSDLFEGARQAGPEDVRAIETLLAPLEADGTLLPRPREQLLRELPFFTVVERDGAVVACAATIPWETYAMAEVAAFAVNPAYRGKGRGDALLAYLEAEASARGIQRLFLLTTRTADWFAQRGFVSHGAAWNSEELPPARRAAINRARNSRLFIKDIDVGRGEDSES